MMEEKLDRLICAIEFLVDELRLMRQSTGGVQRTEIAEYESSDFDSIFGRKPNPHSSTWERIRDEAIATGRYRTEVINGSLVERIKLNDSDLW